MKMSLLAKLVSGAVVTGFCSVSLPALASDTSIPAVTLSPVQVNPHPRSHYYNVMQPDSWRLTIAVPVAMKNENIGVNVTHQHYEMPTSFSVYQPPQTVALAGGHWHQTGDLLEYDVILKGIYPSWVNVTLTLPQQEGAPAMYTGYRHTAGKVDFKPLAETHFQAPTQFTALMRIHSQL